MFISINRDFSGFLFPRTRADVFCLAAGMTITGIATATFGVLGLSSYGLLSFSIYLNQRLSSKPLENAQKVIEIAEPLAAAAPSETSEELVLSSQPSPIEPVQSPTSPVIAAPLEALADPVPSSPPSPIEQVQSTTSPISSEESVGLAQSSTSPISSEESVGLAQSSTSLISSEESVGLTQSSTSPISSDEQGSSVFASVQVVVEEGPFKEVFSATFCPLPSLNLRRGILRLEIDERSLRSDLKNECLESYEKIYEEIQKASQWGFLLANGKIVYPPALPE